MDVKTSLMREPVHVVYGGAHLFRADTASKLGAVALRSLDTYARDPAALATATGVPTERAEVIRARIADKLAREPVEDLRVDFEDGYGVRSDAEEDGHATAAAAETAKGMSAGSLPPFFGIRIKALDEEHRGRGARTLDLYLTALAQQTGGRVPANMVVTLPKITSPSQVAALADLLDVHQGATAIGIELMIETPQSIFAPTGQVALPALIAAGRGRVTAAHFGAYDYTASLGITAAHQRLTHPACDFARHVMQVACADTGVRVSDGATTLLPIAPHRDPRSDAERAENERAVHRAWRLHHDHVYGALVNGLYQGWDLHPAQLVARYAAVYAFFLEGIDASVARLKNFLDQAARATHVGGVFDDAATGQGLLNVFLRALSCGAIGEEEAARLSGLTAEELRSRSFSTILRSRRPG